MPTTEEQELILRVQGTIALEQLNKELAKEDQLLRATIQAGAAAAGGQAAYDAAIAKSAAAMVNLNKEIVKTQGATKGYQQNITGLGYAMNDFLSVSGGLDQRLNAIANNLPMLFAGMGGLGLALSGIVPIVAALYKNWDSLNAALTGGGRTIPESTDAVKRLDAELKKVGESLTTLREKQSLTNFELMDFNKLSKEELDLQRQRNDELERRKNLEAVTGIVGKERQERAAGFKEAVAEAGGGETAISDLKAALERLNPDQTMVEIAKKADQLMSEAGLGWKDAIEEVRKTIRAGQPDEKRQKLADAIQASTPEAKKGREIGEARQKAQEEQAKEAEQAEAEKRRLNAASVADQAREQAEAVSLTRQTFGEELKEQATAGLVGGIDRDKLKADLKAGLRAKLAQADDFREPVQEAVAEELVTKIVGDIQNADIIKAKAAGARGEKKAQTTTQRAADILGKQTDVDEQAAALTAQVRAQGGVNGRRMNAEQQKAYIQNEIVRYLVRNGLAGAQNAQMAAEPIAEGASARVDAAMQQQNRASGMGLSNQAKLIGVAQMLSMQAQQAAQVQQSHSQAINQLFQMNGRGPQRRTLARRGG
jgi:hypothetical protein